MVSIKEPIATAVRDQQLSRLQSIEFKPRTVDLVECLQTAQQYLRAYQDGFIYWQPVSRSEDSFIDTGVWRTGSEYHRRYWFNLGSWRRRDGHYYPS